MPPGPVSDDRAIGGALAAACRELRPSEIAAVYEDRREASGWISTSLLLFTQSADTVNTAFTDMAFCRLAGRALSVCIRKLQALTYLWMVLACDANRPRSWSSRRFAPRTRPSARSSAGHKMLLQASATHGARQEAAHARLQRFEHPSNPAQTDGQPLGRRHVAAAPSAKHAAAAQVPVGVQAPARRWWRCGAEGAGCGGARCRSAARPCSGAHRKRRSGEVR